MMRKKLKESFIYRGFTGTTFRGICKRVCEKNAIFFEKVRQFDGRGNANKSMPCL